MSINSNPLILVVDDNEDILFNIKLSLEINNYQVVTASNGKQALEILSEIDSVPEVIISDIMMPEMDGYDFFKAVSEEPKWNRIPFVFLTARASPNDVRFGKMLGVDDYLTKPFRQEDLLAIISGKIARNKKIESIDKKMEEILSSLNIGRIPSISGEEKTQVALLYVIWDDIRGPTLKNYFPTDEAFPFSITEVGQQLFQATVSIYGNMDITKAEGILLNIENIGRYGYIFFDSYPDETMRAKERQYMIAVIAPKINYFESLKIKDLFKEISIQIKERKSYNLRNFWERVSNVLLSPAL